MKYLRLYEDFQFEKTTFSQFKKSFDTLDWTGDMSDDFRYWASKERQISELKKIYAGLNKEDKQKAVDYWNNNRKGKLIPKTSVKDLDVWAYLNNVKNIENWLNFIYMKTGKKLIKKTEIISEFEPSANLILIDGTEIKLKGEENILNKNQRTPKYELPDGNWVDNFDFVKFLKQKFDLEKDSSSIVRRFLEMPFQTSNFNSLIGDIIEKRSNEKIYINRNSSNNYFHYIKWDLGKKLMDVLTDKDMQKIIDKMYIYLEGKGKNLAYSDFSKGDKITVEEFKDFLKTEIF